MALAFKRQARFQWAAQSVHAGRGCVNLMLHGLTASTAAATAEPVGGVTVAVGVAVAVGVTVGARVGVGVMISPRLLTTAL